MTVDPRCYRDQSKRDRTPYWGQVQRWVFKAKSKTEWEESFGRLTDKEQWDVLRAYTPVPKEVKVDADTTISLVINGVRQITPIDNTIQQALDAHQDDVEDDNT